MALDYGRYFAELDSSKYCEEARAASFKQNFYKNHAKRALDVLLVLIAGIPVLTALVVLSILVALDGKSPFYAQTRIGRNGKRFKMWKLRSMVDNADQKLEAYLQENPEARSEWDSTQKLKHDPRITTVGQIIRKSSLDELPQLWNVLVGDMSLVGPRPMLPQQQVLYPGSAYYEMRPGLTGYWQISERNECSFADRAPIDSRYYREQSLKTDLSVMFKTVGVVVNATGY